MKINSMDVLKYMAFSLMVMLILYVGSILFVPMFYGLFIAIVLYPVCKKLEQYGWSRSLAITAGLFIVVILFAVLLIVLVLQVNAFRIDIPQLQTKLQPLLQQCQYWITENFNITAASQNEWLSNILKQTGNNVSSIFRSTFNTIFILFLTPVFSALFLYNRRDFVLFLTKLVKDKDHQKLAVILNETIHSYFNFIKGMIIVYIIVGVLNSIGLLALGIKHALLFGFLTAVMTIIPYIGIFISSLLPISMAWITKGSAWYPLGVIGIFAFVQYLEANVIFPKVVGTKLNISTWATLVAVLAGNILWGVAGMILFIPFVGILKIITDHMPEWQALNILLSREQPTTKNNYKPKKANVQAEYTA